MLKSYISRPEVNICITCKAFFNMALDKYNII